MRPGVHHAPFWSLCFSSLDQLPSGPGEGWPPIFVKGLCDMQISRIMGRSPWEPAVIGSWASSLSPRVRARTGAPAGGREHRPPRIFYKKYEEVESREHRPPRRFDKMWGGWKSPLGLVPMVPPPSQETLELNSSRPRFPKSGNLFLKGQRNPF